MIKLESLDHLVLTVRSIPASIDFYSHILGMDVITFDEGRKALRFDQQKINLHEYGRSFEPCAKHPFPGSADLCFITQQPIDAVMDALRQSGVTQIDGPIHRTGAIGQLVSIYIRDPDGNLIEIANNLNL
ncbi:VOC family protein [Egbenema bharatensis]|uniref:VOC family protein n=1 Tax=Egbenema bharatensis TaxID=3463334 RepID=UPI003A85A2A7